MTEVPFLTVGVRSEGGARCRHGWLQVGGGKVMVGIQ